MPPRLSVFIASSLDGYIATRDGKLDWLMSAAGSDEDYGYAAFMGTVDALAMGRGTYDFIADVSPWPFSGKQVFVFTHRPPAARQGVTFWAIPPSKALARWSEAGLQRVYVDGGRLIRAFLAEGLIDDLTITLVPRLLGDGIPLFRTLGRETRLLLQGSTVFPSGMVTLSYTRALPGVP